MKKQPPHRFPEWEAVRRCVGAVQPLLAGRALIQALQALRHELALYSEMEVRIQLQD